MSTTSTSSTRHPDQEGSWMPQTVLKFYSKFPLVVLPGEKSPVVQSDFKDPVLWVKPTYDDDSYGWASSDPACLRVQLLFLLRESPVQFRAWENVDSAPDSTLPALHLPTGELLSSTEIRPWLEKETPLPEDVRSLNGMSSQEAHTMALAHSQLILSKIQPAFTTLQPLPTSLHLPFPLPTTPIPLSGTIYHNLPLWLRDLAGAESRQSEEHDLKEREGCEGIRTLGGLVKEHVKDGRGWFLNSNSPSPLDALIASHIYPLTTLPLTFKLRQAVEEEPELVSYVQRIMEVAGKRVRGHVRLSAAM